MLVEMERLPIGLIVHAFERGTSPAAIAQGFGCDVRDVVDGIVGEYRERGVSDDEIAERFGQVWGLD